MPEAGGQEKTEQATSRRKNEARKDGNVAKSTDLTAAFTLLIGVLALYVFGHRIMQASAHAMQVALAGSFSENVTRIDSLAGMGASNLKLMAFSVVPVALLVMSVAMIGTIWQVGFMITGKPLIPSFNKLNPISGFKRFVDARAMMRFAQSLGKLILIAAVSWILIQLEIESILALAHMPVIPALAASAELVFMLSIKLTALLLILAFMDFAFQRAQHARDLRMTKEEVKQEMKDMDGDPLVKQRRARVARQLAMQRIASAVPQADVIVTNPTHFAIALKYDRETMRSPKVIAKGQDFMAMRIRQIALSHGIPLVERKPLARALYANVEIGQEIPPEHYTAVAEVLAYVYRLAGEAAAA